jgi:hypothetical protein
MCIKINKVGKQEVGIWRVQKRYSQYGIPIWRLWPKIRFLPSTFTEKNATMDRVKQYTPLPLRGAGGIIKWWQLNIWPNFKVHGPSQLKIIGLERNVSLICNSSLYTRIPKIKSISPRIAKKSGDNYIFGKISKSKGHNSAKNHCTGTERNVNLICNLSLY